MTGSPSPLSRKDSKPFRCEEQEQGAPLFSFWNVKFKDATPINTKKDVADAKK